MTSSIRLALPPEKVEVGRAIRFCNPTRKWHAGTVFGVADIRQHLTLYRTFPESSPLRIAVISNQFGQQQTLRVRDAVALAVPTQKSPHNAPQGLDHFRCYAASGNPVGQGVGLGDQFIPALTGHLVLDPLLFCNPVEKTHGTVVTPIAHPEAHLTCYSMTRVPFTREVATRNQFGAQTLVVGRPDILCVPTKKLRWQEIPDGPVGAGKGWACRSNATSEANFHTRSHRPTVPLVHTSDFRLVAPVNTS